MKATFDIRGDIQGDVRTFVAAASKAYEAIHNCKPTHITASSAMRGLISTIYGNPHAHTTKRNPVKLFGLWLRENKKMSGFTLSVCTRKPLSDKSKTKARTRGKVRREVKRAINGGSWGKRGQNKIMGIHEKSPGVFEAEVSVMMPMNHIYMDFKVSP